MEQSVLSPKIPEGRLGRIYFESVAACERIIKMMGGGGQNHAKIVTSLIEAN